MIKLVMEQRSPEWIAARVGIPTASSFDRIITKTGKASSAAQGYIEDLVAEYFGGHYQDGRVGVKRDVAGKDAYVILEIHLKIPEFLIGERF